MSTQNLLETLRHIVGAKYVITDPSKTERYRTGYRFGTGNAIAVVRPATLWEQWQVLEACVAADVIVISQAANTGITGGSNPFGNDYDRDVVIIFTIAPKINKIHDLFQKRIKPTYQALEHENRTQKTL